MKGTGYMDNDTRNIGIVVSLAEFDEDGKYGGLTPVVSEFNVRVDEEGHGIASLLFEGPLQKHFASVYRNIAIMLREIALGCEREADELEEGGEHDLDNTDA